MSNRTHVDGGVEGGARSPGPPYFSTDLLRRYIRPIGVTAVLHAVRSSRSRDYHVPIRRIAFWAAALVLVGLFFWQIFVTMPHVSTMSADTLSYFQKEPQRGAGVYYFFRLVLSVWNNLYAIAAVQGLLLGAVGLLLGYSVRRATGSALLGLAALIVCLFKVSLVFLTQDICSDSVFSTACIGLLAAALLLWERASPGRIVLFLLFAFAASVVRSVAAAILWPILFALALRLWATQRRALAAVVAGSIAVYAATATIGFINYGFWAPHTQVGQSLICDVVFIADENVPPEIPYPHKFAAASVKARDEYEKASAWKGKFEIIDQYSCGKAWRIARSSVDRDSGVDRLPCFAYITAVNEIYKRAALAVIRHNPLGYLKMASVKFVAGVQMLSSYDNFPFRAVYTQQEAEHRIAQAEEFIDVYKQPNDCARPEFLDPMISYINDWRTTPLDLRSDVARPLRGLFDLVSGVTVNWLFIAESAAVMILIAIAVLRRRRIADTLGLLFLLIIPVWAYLSAICLIILPMDRYMDATSPFVYIALIVGGYALVSASLTRFWEAVKMLANWRPFSRGNAAQVAIASEPIEQVR